ncbi:MAG: urea ABC transporter ATP-binding subunit UrtE [Myxococcales bacterium]|nr:MAG: urea ABC transporter ATP-binding subunit UrtE [Myxococcales bacterium]
MLEVSGLNQFYGESHTLWDMDLKVPEGSCVCLMGRNGVGKTTLLKSIMGALPVRSGKITFMGSDIAPTRAEMRARKGIGWVPQGREVFSMMTVQENLRTGLAARADKKKEIPERIFELFPVLKSMLQRRGGDLSGGQQQQLAMGRALALDPKLLILDEPTEGIQPNIVSMIGDVLISLKEKGLTQLLVEQKLPFARRVGDYFCIMDRGRAVATGKMSELSDEIVNKHLKV